MSDTEIDLTKKKKKKTKFAPEELDGDERASKWYFYHFLISNFKFWPKLFFNKKDLKFFGKRIQKRRVTVSNISHQDGKQKL